MQTFILIALSLLSANFGFNFASEINIEDTLLKILQSLEDVKTQLNSLEASLSNGCSIRDISDAIKGHKFELAKEQIMELADKRKIIQIVHIVYAGSPSNMDVILDFANELTDSDTKFRVFNALHDEMRSSGNSDPFKLITLVETMERTISKQANANADIKAKAQEAIDHAVTSVMDSSASIFKTAMLTDKYQNNSEVEDLSTSIFNFRTDLSDQLMNRVVDSVFGVVAAKKILENISSHRHIPQVITGLTAVFNRFNFAGNLNNNAILDLASQLRSLQQRNGYAAIDQKLKDEVDDIIQRLPTCAKSLYFYQNICFWNKGKAAYMYAASSENSYDEKRRNLFTSSSGNLVTGAVWNVEKIDEYFYFKNVHHVNEYLYSLDAGPRDKDTRYVFTWMPGYNMDDQARFIIELDGNYCYLKSSFHNEYLFASSVKYDKFNSYVFTWAAPTIGRGAEFQWELRNCDRGK